MAVQRILIEGRPATVAYMDEDFQPVEAEGAPLIKVLFDDGESMILAAPPETDDPALDEDYVTNLSRNLEDARAFKDKDLSADQEETRTVLVIRHGETDMNDPDPEKDRIRGWENVELNAKGRQQAHETARKLIEDDNVPDVLVSSDLDRALHTALIISKETGAPVVWVSRGFRPWNVGVYVGEISAHAVPILGKYMQTTPDEPVPGGESFCNFSDRFFGATAEALDRFKGKVGIVAHHRNERILDGWEEAGYPLDGNVDIEVFTQKGEGTGECMEFELPLDRLNAVAGRSSAAISADAGFDPSEPRDPSGEWTSGGGAGRKAEKPKGAKAPTGSEPVTEEQFEDLASKGIMHGAGEKGERQPTKKELAKAGTPVDYGRIYGYTEADIARFYRERRNGHPIAYREYLRDLEASGFDPIPTPIERILQDLPQDMLAKAIAKRPKNLPPITNLQELHTRLAIDLDEVRRRPTTEAIMNTPERKKLQKQIVDTLWNNRGFAQPEKHGNLNLGEPLKKERRIDVVLGPSASGKSGYVAEPLVKEHSALLIDSDEDKRMLPEFDNGVGANAVHEESSRMAEYDMTKRALAEGANIVLPMIGKNLEKTRGILKSFADANYDVHLHYVDLPIDKAVQRSILRYISTGRTIDPNYINGIDAKPKKTYLALKDEPYVRSHHAVSTDVALGAAPRPLDW